MSNDPYQSPEVITELIRRSDLASNAVSSFDPQRALQLQRQATIAPNLSPRILLNVNRAGISDETLQILNQTTAKYNQEKSPLKSIDSAWDKVYEAASSTPGALFGGLKTVVRYGTTLGESGSSLINNYVFQEGKTPKEQAVRFAKLIGSALTGGSFSATNEQESQDFLEAAKRTEFGTYLEFPELRGEGYFMSPDTRAIQEMRASEFRTKVGPKNQPATVGGSFVDTLGVNVESWYGSLASGAIDTVVEIAADPTNAITGPIFETATNLLKGLRLSSKISSEAVEQLAKSKNLTDKPIRTILALGKESGTISTTSRSWSEIAEARRAFQSKVDDINKQTELWNKTNGASGIDPAIGAEQINLAQSAIIQAETKIWNADLLSEQIRTNKHWTRLFTGIDMLPKGRNPAEIAQRAVVIRQNIFRGLITVDDAMKLAAAEGPDGYRRIFLEAADGLRNQAPSLPSTIKKITGGAPTRVLRTAFPDLSLPSAYERVVSPLRGAASGSPDGAIDRVASQIKRMFSLKPEVNIMVDGSAAQRTQAADGFYRTLRSLMPNDSDTNFILRQTGRAYEALSSSPVNVVERVRGQLVSKQMPHHTRAALKSVEDEILPTVFRYYIKKYGNVNTKTADEVMNIVYKDRTAARLFAIDEAGNPTDFGFVKRLHDAGLINLDEVAEKMSTDLGQVVSRDQIYHHGAAAITELYNHTLIMPDWVSLRQIVENPLMGRLWQKAQDGDPTAIKSVADMIVNRGWKSLTLMNVGYFLRNIFDGQLRLFVTGAHDAASLFSQQLEYLRVVKNKRVPIDLDGRPLSQQELVRLSNEVFETLTPSEVVFTQVGRAQNWGTQSEVLASLERSLKSKDLVAMPKVSGSEPYANAVIDQVKKNFKDPLERIYLAVGGLVDDPVMRRNMVLDWMFQTETGKRVQAQLLEAAQQKLRVAVNQVPQAPGYGRTLKLSLDTQEEKIEYFSALIDTHLAGRAPSYFDIPEIKAMTLHNVVPVADDFGGSITTIKEVSKDFVGGMTKWFTGEDKAFFKYRPETVNGGLWVDPETGIEHFIYAVRKDAQGKYFADLMQVSKVDDVGNSTRQTAFGITRDFVTPESRNIVLDALSQSANDAKFPPYVLARPQVSVVAGAGEKWNQLVNFVFGNLMQKGENYLEKLPAYRQFKWDIYNKNYESMSGAALREVRDTIAAASRETGISPDDYMGIRPRVRERVKLSYESKWERLNSLIDRTPADKAGYSVEEMTNYASHLALQEMKEMFYDAPKKLNIETSGPIGLMYQFLAAQRTIAKTWASNALAHPNKMYRATRAYGSLTELEVPQDGGGKPFVTKDPVSGLDTFNHPLGILANAIYQGYEKITGNEPNNQLSLLLSAPTRGLNIGIGGPPNANPLGQLGIGAVIGSVEKVFGAGPPTEFARQVFLPYQGRVSGQSLLQSAVPSWLAKTFVALTNNKSMLSALMARNTLESYAALDTTGKYGNDRNGRQKLDSDAQILAQVMTLFSAVTQFLGPASASPEYMIELEGIDVNVAELAKKYKELTDADFETAPIKFAQIWGVEAINYIAGKTKTDTEAKGVLLTDRYLSWYKENKQDIEFYSGSGIGAYFGPVDEDIFSFGARAYLMENNQTRWRSGLERRRAAEYAMGAAEYRNVREQAPIYLNKEQQTILKNYKNGLQIKYPGFELQFDPQKLTNQMNALNKIIVDDAFGDSPIKPFLQEYLGKRNAFLEASGRTTFRSKAMTDLRLALLGKGEDLARQSPEFARLFDRVLVFEVDLAGEDE